MQYAVGHAHFCRADCKCAHGEGDCDHNGEGTVPAALAPEPLFRQHNCGVGELAGRYILCRNDADHVY